MSLDDLAEQNLEAAEIDGLRQIVVRALFDRFDGDLDGALCGEEHGRDVLAQFGDLVQKVEAADFRHDQIAVRRGDLFAAPRREAAPVTTVESEYLN